MSLDLWIFSLICLVISIVGGVLLAMHDSSKDKPKDTYVSKGLDDSSND